LFEELRVGFGVLGREVIPFPHSENSVGKTGFKINLLLDLEIGLYSDIARPDWGSILREPRKMDTHSGIVINKHVAPQS